MRNLPREDSLLVEFAWSCWAELGLSTWDRSHQEWCHDPEALLVLTGCLGEMDRRLRGEVLDWCSSAMPLLSRTRARNILRTWPEQAAWPAFATDLTAATGKKWEGSAGAGSFAPTGKSELLLVQRAGAMALRARAILGVGARSEILRILTTSSSARTWSKQELALEVGYARRNVHDAVEQLILAGVLQSQGSEARARIRLSAPDLWRQLLEPLPLWSGSGLAVCRAAWRIRGARLKALSKEPALRSLIMRKEWDLIRPDLERAGWKAPMIPDGTDAWQELEPWTLQFLTDLAGGRTPADAV